VCDAAHSCALVASSGVPRGGYPEPGASPGRPKALPAPLHRPTSAAARRPQGRCALSADYGQCLSISSPRPGGRWHREPSRFRGTVLCLATSDAALARHAAVIQSTRAPHNAGLPPALPTRSAPRRPADRGAQCLAPSSSTEVKGNRSRPASGSTLPGRTTRFQLPMGVVGTRSPYAAARAAAQALTPSTAPTEAGGPAPANHRPGRRARDRPQGTTCRSPSQQTTPRHWSR